MVIAFSFREMSRWRSAVTGAVCLLLVIPATLSRAQTRPTVYHVDLDGDGQLERISLSPENAFQLSIRRGSRLLWIGIPQRWLAWKLQIADVDGDGRPDILVGIRKSTRFFPEPHNCLFVYGWDGHHVYPKWLGSSLSRSFTDFQTIQQERGRPVRLAAIEVGRDDRRSLAIYSWNGFGFSLDERVGDWASALSLAADGTSITLMADGRSTTVRPMR